jgi:murein DD-endopeptidase MepM/ murein hydrolase activator NlpD
MKRLLFLVVLVALLPASVNAQTRRIVEMGITSPEMAQYFQQHAGAQDIARVDHPNDIGLISGISVGKRMVIFKSAAQIQQFMASNASALDIIGYNLEPGQTHDAAELANPVAAAKAVQAIARQYGKQVAVGLTHDLTLQYGAAMAPYADIWVLQIQKAQNDPAMAGEFVSQMVPALQRANPAIVVFVQIRTDSSPAALTKLVNGLGNVHVSILTQRSDVQDAVNVAGAFFGGQQQAASSAPANFRPVAMANGSQYGIRVPSKIAGCYAPVAGNLIGSDEEAHARRGSPTLAWDWSVSVGSPVFPMCPGTVRRVSSANEGGYGWNIVIDHGNGLSTLYAHCKENSFRVKVGQQVDVWTQICTVGRTGLTSWPHVHLNIDVNGKHTRVGQYFDASQFVQCHFTKCQATNDPAAPIYTGSGNMVTGQQQQATVTTVTETPYSRLAKMLRRLGPNAVASITVALFALLCLIWWVGGLYERVFVVAFGTSLVVVAVALWLFMPTQAQATAVGQRSVTAGGDSWKTAYAFMRKWEGNRCVHDPVRTLKGITQGTYTAWRKSLGLGQADVCTSLTEEQAEAIYYQRYWLASGADKLEPAAALVVFDHAVNAGVGEGVALVAQCGSDVQCLINARYADYKTKGNCAQYCKAWFNRVNDLVKYLQKGS